MINERTFKIAVFSFLINTAYGAYCCYIGVKSGSWWFITLASYYMTLGIMRFSIIASRRTVFFKIFEEKYLLKFTGVLFIVLSVILAGTAYLLYHQEQGIRHHEIVMISIALYSFSKITISIINLVKIKKNDLPSIKTLRNISFADALVSIFSLQRSMLVTFDGLTETEVKIFNILTGTAVYVLVFIMGLNMIGGKLINMAKSKIIEINEKIAETVVEGYKKIENVTVGSYKKIEEGVVKGYSGLEDKFVGRFLAKEGETVTEAKERLKKENK